MDHQAKPGEKLADNPKRIWLAPRCMFDERTWCEDDIGGCDECGEPTVEYVRSDLVEPLRAALGRIGHDSLDEKSRTIARIALGELGIGAALALSK